jgi:IS4 transposase
MGVHDLKLEFNICDPFGFKQLGVTDERGQNVVCASHGVIFDQTIALNGYYVAQDYPEHLRRIKFKDPASGKNLIFLTNNTTLPPLTIAALYKNRWQVELFFKWIKQHLRIKKFLGTSENAVKTHIWCAVSTNVLIAIVKKGLQLDASLYTLLQILSVSVF